MLTSGGGRGGVVPRWATIWRAGARRAVLTAVFVAAVAFANCWCSLPSLARADVLHSAAGFHGGTSPASVLVPGTLGSSIASIAQGQEGVEDDPADSYCNK
jgi:hypothetical protein